MSSDTTALGDRMKGYEAAARLVLPRRTHAIVRADMRAAHTYLRLAGRPFDAVFMGVMDATAEAMCAEMAGSVLAYVQSDEISVLLADYGSVHVQPWFGGVVQKTASIAAAVATAEFNHLAWAAGGRLDVPHYRAVFDARVFTIPDPVDVANYFVWRQRDCLRNSVAMAAQAHFPQGRLHGLSGDQMQELLWQEKGVNWGAYPDGAKRGRVCVRAVQGEEVAYTDRRTGAEHETYAVRSRWVAAAAPGFKAEPGTFLAEIIPPLPSLVREAAGQPANSQPG